MKLFSLILFIFFASILNAQNYVDLVKFHYANTPHNDFDSIGGNSNIEEYGVDITLPIVLKNKNAIVTGLMTERISTKLHPLFPNYTISTYNLKLGYNMKHSDKLSGTYMFLPKISSDMKNIGSKDFQYGGLILMKITKKKNLKYNAGVYFNSDLFGPFTVPLIGLYYKSSNDKFEINATLPVWADMNYTLTKWLTVGSNFSAIVRSYRLSEDNAYVVKKTNEIYGYLQFNVKKSFLLQTKIGHSIGRSYSVYNENDRVNFGLSAFRFGDNRNPLNPNLNDGVILQARIIYRFNIKLEN